MSHVAPQIRGGWRSLVVLPRRTPRGGDSPCPNRRVVGRCDVPCRGYQDAGSTRSRPPNTTSKLPLMSLKMELAEWLLLLHQALPGRFFV